MLQRVLVARHATRLDTIDPDWRLTSPTPYDPPLSQQGVNEAKALGRAVASEIAATAQSCVSPAVLETDLSCASASASLSSLESVEYASTSHVNVYVHTSPFLRCAMTAHYIAEELSKTNNVTIRMDAFLGEWLTPDYFATISPPPDDGHASLAASSAKWLLQQGSALDLAWPLTTLGTAGEYGERWRTMYARFSAGLETLVRHYDGRSDNTVVVLVTHGAGANALVGALANHPILVDIGLASLSVAVPSQYSYSHSHSYHSAYGYGGEKRNLAGYVVDPISPVSLSDKKWDITRIADVSHLKSIRPKQVTAIKSDAKQYNSFAEQSF